MGIVELWRSVGDGKTRHPQDIVADDSVPRELPELIEEPQETRETRPAAPGWVAQAAEGAGRGLREEPTASV